MRKGKGMRRLLPLAVLAALAAALAAGTQADVHDRGGEHDSPTTTPIRQDGAGARGRLLRRSQHLNRFATTFLPEAKNGRRT